MYARENKNITRSFNKKVSVAHSLAELNLLEQNLFNLFQYILTKAYKYSYSEECVMSYAAFRHFMGSKLPSSSKSVEELFASLHSKKIILNVLNEKGTKKVATSGVSMIGDYDLPKNEDENIVIEIPKHLIETIRAYGKPFPYSTSLLKVAKESKSKYTPRIYDFLYRYASAGEHIPIPKLTIKDFRDICGVATDSYESVSELVRRVIKPAQEEARDKFGLEFKYNLEKIGRKAKYITFEFDIEQRKKATDFVEKEKAKDISDEDDFFVSHARKHSEEQNVRYFNESLLFDSVSHVESTNTALYYKIYLTKGKPIIESFSDIKATLDYERALKKEKEYKGDEVSAALEVPALHQKLKPSTLFDPTMVKYPKKVAW